MGTNRSKFSRVGAAAALFVTGAVVSSIGDGPNLVEAVPPDSYQSLVLDDDPRGYWRLDEQPGETTAADIAGSGRNATYSGAPGSFILGEPSAIGDGSSLYLDGSEGYVYVADSWTPEAVALAPTAELSVELWFQPETLPNDNQRHQLARWRWFGWGLHILNGRVYSELWEGTTASQTNTLLEGPELEEGNWYHLVVTKDANESRLFVDGVEVDAGVSNGPMFYDTVLPDCCGGVGGGVGFGRDADVNAFYFQGWLDEIAVYGNALTTNSVSNHHDRGREGAPDAPPADTFGYQPGGGYAEDPVHTGSGSLWMQAGDITSGATGPARLFERAYNSRDRRIGVLGRGWSTILDSSLNIEGDDVSYRAPDGRTTTFVGDGFNNFIRPDGVFADLTANPGSYQVEFADGQTMTFDQDGQLDTVTLWTGESVSIQRSTASTVTSMNWSTGESLQFAYDSNGLLTSVESDDGRVASYTYDDLRMSSSTALDGSVDTYTWTIDGYLESATSPDGVLTMDNVYDDVGRVTAQTTPTGSSTFVYDSVIRTTVVTNVETGDSITYLHDDALRLIGAIDDESGTVNIDLNADGLRTSTTDRLGHQPDVTYDAMGNITSTNDPIRGVTNYAYDSQYRVVSRTEPTGAVTTMAYEDNERLPTSVTDGLGNTTTFDIVDGLIAEATDPDGITTTYSYNPGRRMIAKANGLGETTTYEYDAAGRQIATTTPLGFETERTLDDLGRTLTETAPDGGVTTFVYDSFGRVLSVTDPVGATSTNTYDSTTGFLTSQTDPLGRVTTYDYDDVGRLTESTANDNSTNSTDYGLLGRVTTSDDELDRAQTYGYDADGNPTETVAPDGGVTTSEYDTAGRVTATVDSLGRRTGHTYDQFGRLEQMTQPDTTVITYAYDILGRRTTVTAPDGGTSTTTFTPGGRAAAITDPEGGIRTYTHDPAGRLASITDPNGNTTTHTYDADGRRTASTSSEGLVTAWEYDPSDRVTSLIDPAGVEVSRTYTLIGQVATEQLSGEGVRAFTYNLDGTLDTVTDALGNTTTMGYDNVGRLDSRTDATGATETWTHNAAGEITRYTDRLGRDTDLTYDANGRLATTTDPTGRSATFSYNTAGELLNRTYGDGDTVSFTYDANGRRAAMADSTGTTTYTYDANGRPTVVDAPSGTLAYSYDLAGRRTGLTYPDGTTATYGYDTAGRLLSVTHPDHGTTNYTHSPDGRVVRADRPDGTSRVYDYTDGRLVRQDDAGVITNLTYDDAGRVNTLTGAQVHTYSYDLAGQLVQADQGADTYNYTYGNRGEITIINDPDRTRTVTHNASTEITDIADDQGNTGTVTHDDAGRLVEHLDPNGDLTTYTYDSQGRLASTTFTDTSNGGGDPVLDPCEGLVATITGTEGDDVLQGTWQDDIIFGLGGNDTITGASGSDTICGGDGDDNIQGQSQADTIFGGAGNDTITGADGDDTIDGGPGNDTISGDSQNDTIQGGDGDDTINGNSGNDILDGGNGNDIVDGSWQTDTCDDAEQAISCETITNNGEPDAPPIDPPNTNPTTSVTRTYNGDNTLVQLDSTVNGASEQINLLWDDTIEIPQIVEWDGGTVDYGRLIYGYNREAAPDANIAFAATALGDLGPNTAPFGQADDSTIDFGYRGELDIHGDTYLRNRTLIGKLGVFNDTDPLDGIAGTSTFATPFHYADNDPINQLDPLGLRPEDADFGTYRLIQPIPSCSAVREGGGCLDEFAVLGFDYTLDSSDNREWMAIVDDQMSLCFSDTNQSAVLNIRFNNQPELRDICLWWSRQQGEVYRDVTCSREVFGKCFSTRLGWEGVQENATEIILNSVTLGGYNAFRCGRLTSESYFTGDLETRVEGTTACASTVFVAAGAGSIKFNVRGLLRAPRSVPPTSPGSLIDDVVGLACSFSASTHVLLANGTTKPISEVVVGDEVIAYDPETGEGGRRIVTNLWVHQDSLLHLEIDGEVVETTEDHPFWNAGIGAWQRADEFAEGDVVLTSGGNTARVTGAIQNGDQVELAYNLSVEGLHTYFVAVGEQNVLVHNTCFPKPTRVVNSKITHAAPRAVERAGFATVEEAKTALRALSDSIKKSGFPSGTIKDTARADRVLVPFGKGGYAVYQIRPNGTAVLQTVLKAR